MDSFSAIIKKDYRIFVLFFVLICIFYGNTLSNGFILDDHAVIERNSYVQSLQYLPKVFTGCIWESALGNCQATLYYRPVMSLSLLLTSQISLKPWLFRLVNLFYLFLAVSLVYLVGSFIISKRFLAFCAAIIFLIHPVNNEIGNWISTMPDVTLAIFILLDLYFYFRYQKTKSNRDLILLNLFFFLGLLAKEQMIELIIIFIAIDLLFFKIKSRDFLKRDQVKKYVCILVPLLVYYLMRRSVLGPFNRITSEGKDFWGPYTISERVYAFVKLFAIYLGEFVYPLPLMMLRQFEIKNNLANVSFLFYVLIFGGFVFIIYWLVKKKQNLLALSLIWFFVFLLLPLSVFWVAGGDVYAERYLFVPSIGLCFFVAAGLNSFHQGDKKILAFFKRVGLVFREKQRRQIVMAVIALIIVVSWIVVFPNNKNWRDDVTIFRANIAQDNKTAFFHSVLADELFNRGDYEGAKKEYETIIQLNPPHYGLDVIYSNLGDHYYIFKDYAKAEEHYLKAFELSGGKNYESNYQLGNIAAEKGDYLLALVKFCQATSINPAPDAQTRYDRVVSILTGVEEKDWPQLYNEIIRGKAFRKDQTGKIRLKYKACLYNNCVYTLDVGQMENEIIFPFLIMAKILPEGTVVRVNQPSYNPNKGEISVSIDNTAENKGAEIVFPTCSGSYYEVIVPTVNQ